MKGFTGTAPTRRSARRTIMAHRVAWRSHSITRFPRRTVSPTGHGTITARSATPCSIACPPPTSCQARRGDLPSIGWWWTNSWRYMALCSIPIRRCHHREAGAAGSFGRAVVIAVLPPLVAPPSKHPLGDVVAPQIGGPQIAERDLGGFMPGLAHQFGESGTLVTGGGGEAGAEAVPGIALRIEAGVQRGLLDQAGDRLVGEFCPGDPAGLGDGAEQRPFGPRGGCGGRVEVGCGATMHEPGLEGGEGTETGLPWVGPDRDLLALALLVGLGAAHQHAQAAARDGGDVAQGERDQLGAAQRGAEAEQQHG